MGISLLRERQGGAAPFEPLKALLEKGFSLKLALCVWWFVIAFFFVWCLWFVCEREKPR